jgi:hypothetical protein
MIPTLELPIHVGTATITYPTQIIVMPDVVVTYPQMLFPVPTTEVGPPDEMTPTTGILRWTP